jgi:hypothetical protein
MSDGVIRVSVALFLTIPYYFPTIQSIRDRLGGQAVYICVPGSIAKKNSIHLFKKAAIGTERGFFFYCGKAYLDTYEVLHLPLARLSHPICRSVSCSR